MLRMLQFSCMTPPPISRRRGLRAELECSPSIPQAIELIRENWKKILQGATEGRIDDDHLAAAQPQDLPDDGADVVHIHLFDDPTRLDLSFKSIPQSIKFIGRFGDEQRHLRQKCQFVYSRHLILQ